MTKWFQMSLRWSPYKCFTNDTAWNSCLEYFDVAYRNWRPNLLVTSWGCRWQVTLSLSRVWHQHQISVTNITFWRIGDVRDQLECHQHAKNVTSLPFWHQYIKMVTIIKSPTLPSPLCIKNDQMTKNAHTNHLNQFKAFFRSLTFHFRCKIWCK